MATATGNTAPRAHGNRLDALDGIRTIAVFLVIAFHVSMPYLHAGFLGVDMFFLLSGYLITAALIREFKRTGKINLANFWSRRFKRLMPAALLTLTTVIIWAAFFAPLYRRADLGADAWWSLFYVANWRFINSSSYFQADGNVSPLLHMWSLAVEEQFYIIWPLLILVIFAIVRRTTRTKPELLKTATFLRPLGIITALLIVCSAVLFSVIYLHGQQDRAYMGTDTKAFEPLLGALLAILVQNEKIKDFCTQYAKLLIWGGALFMGALFIVSDGPAPVYFLGGGFTFSLAMGMFLLGIAHNLHGFEARVLAWQPISYLGRISYGLYLWHWPYAVWLLDPAQGFEPRKSALVVLLTIITAVLSYHLVEMPIRQGTFSNWLQPRRTFKVAASALAAFAVVISLLGGTLLSRVTQPLVFSTDKPNDNVMMIVGDSVARRITPPLTEVAKEQGIDIVSAARGGCTPLAIPMFLGPEDASGKLCPEVATLQQETIEQYNPGTVIWWSRYEIMDRYDEAGEIVTSADPQFWELQEAALQTAIDRLTTRGAKLVFVLTERPGLGTLTRSEAEMNSPVIQSLIYDDAARIKFNELVQKYAADNDNISVVDGDSMFCSAEPGPGPGSLCDDSRDGSYIRYDGTHVDLEKFGTTISAELLQRVSAATNSKN